MAKENRKTLDTQGADGNAGDSSSVKPQTRLTWTYPRGRRITPASLWAGRPTFEEMHQRFINEANEMFVSVFGKDPVVQEFSNLNKPVGRWPKLDIAEDYDNYYIIVAAPGFTNDEVTIEVAPGSDGGKVLMITAEKEENIEESDICTLHSEIRRSKGTRIFPLSGTIKCSVDENAISAKSNTDGTISIILPKVDNCEEVSSRKIGIE